MRPTKEGPAMIFNRVKGHPDARVAIGVLASRKRVAALLGAKPENLGKMLWSSVENPIPPVLTNEPAPCQQIVYKAEEPDLTCAGWFRPPPIRRMTQALILPWVCVMPLTRIRGGVM